MSGIRKFKRYKSIQKKQKTSNKPFVGEMVFVIGIVTLLSGLFYGIYNYSIYTYGSHDHTTESKVGPIFYPEEAPGNPWRMRKCRYRLENRWYWYSIDCIFYDYIHN